MQRLPWTVSLMLTALFLGTAAHAVTSLTIDGHSGPATLTVGQTFTVRYNVRQPGGTADARVRKISADGLITTVAGNGTAGFAGDGGPATAAELDTPVGVAIDPAGNLYIADHGNRRVREVIGIAAPSVIGGQ